MNVSIKMERFIIDSKHSLLDDSFIGLVPTRPSWGYSAVVERLRGFCEKGEPNEGEEELDGWR